MFLGTYGFMTIYDEYILLRLCDENSFMFFVEVNSIHHQMPGHLKTANCMYKNNETKRIYAVD